MVTESMSPLMASAALCDFLQGNDPDGQRARGGKGEENVEGFSARNGAFWMKVERVEALVFVENETRFMG